MSLFLAIVAAAATQRISPEAAAAARNAFDPARLAAAQRLRVADGSEASLEPRLRQAVTVIVRGEFAECLRLVTALPKGRRPDCDKVYAQQAADVSKVPAVIPAMVEQMRQVEQRAYAERFTVEEMDAITAFLQSTAGSKFARESQAMSQDVTVKLRLLLRTTLNGTPAPAVAAPAAAKDGQ